MVLLIAKLPFSIISRGPNSERDSIMLWVVKKFKFQNRFTDLSPEISLIDCHISFEKNLFSLFTSEITSF
jgi:hypothetical protein